MSVWIEWREDALPSSLMVVAPHPDDDVLGCSHLMRRVDQMGGRLVVVWLTDGGASHGVLPAEVKSQLVATRQAEAKAGVHALGIRPVALCFLGYPDGSLELHETEARDRLQTLCRVHQVETVVVTDEHDGHGDHRAAFRIASQLKVKRLFSYPISARYDGENYEVPDHALVISADAGEAKRVALAHHRSQATGGALYPLSALTIDRFCSEPEIFIPIRTGEITEPAL